MCLEGCDVFHSLRLARLSQQEIKPTTHTPCAHNQSLSAAAAPSLILYQRTTGKMPTRSCRDETDTCPWGLLRIPRTTTCDPADNLQVSHQSHIKLQEKLRKWFRGEIYLQSEGGEHSRQDADLFDEQTIKIGIAVRVVHRQNQWAANNRRSTHTHPAMKLRIELLPTATLIGWAVELFIYLWSRLSLQIIKVKGYFIIHEVGPS